MLRLMISLISYISSDQVGLGYGVFWLASVLSPRRNMPRRRGVVAAPSLWPGPGPRPSTWFKYNLRRSVRSYFLDPPTSDNLVSRGSGSTSAMSANSSVGSRVEGEVTLADVVRHLTAIEGILQ
jgi:hypothetical protein